MNGTLETKESATLSAIPGESLPQPARLDSLDAFRGLVILTMIFVNYLAGVKNIPAWARHMPDKMDGYTFVDLVFPAFLFIVGVAIPFALSNRRERGETTVSLLLKIFGRSASLILIGVISVNREAYSEEFTGMSSSAWFLLAMLGVIGAWGSFPAWTASGPWKTVILVLRILSILMLAYLLVIFRGKSGSSEAVWLRPLWWGILGLIGWAYLVCSVAYLVFRGNSLALMGVMAFMIALFIGGRHGVLDWLGPIQNFANVGALFGTNSASVMIGVLVGNSLRSGNAGWTNAARIRFMVIFGMGLFLAGHLLRPLHGIIKNEATDSYTLVAGGICCLAFLPVFVAMDVLKFKRWARWITPVGQNALLAYLLPGIIGNCFRVIHHPGLLHPYASGWPGAINSAVLTGLILLITWLASWANFRLKL